MKTNEPSKMNCEDVLRQLYDYLDGEVDELTEADIEHHVHHCRECFSRMEFEKRLKSKVKESSTMQTPDEVQSRLMEIMRKF